MKAERTLVVGPSWVGDMVMAQVLFTILRDANPEGAIDVLAPPATVSLTQRMAQIDRGIRFEVGHGEFRLGYRFGLAKHLAENGYDHAIVLPNSLKSAIVPAFAGIPRRTGFLGEYRYYLLNDLRLLDKRRLPLMIDRFAALGVDDGKTPPQPLPHPRLMLDAARQAVLRDQFDIGGEPVLGLCPGAEFGPAKQWPAEHHAVLAASALANGWQVLIFGTDKDAAIARVIVTAVQDSAVPGGVPTGRLCDLTGKTSLLDAIDLLGLCDHVVTNDSGLMHVACAVGVPVTAVYGSSSPDFTPPLSERATIASLGLDCAPCFKRTCPLGHTNCLKRLSPGQLEGLPEELAVNGAR